MILGEDLERQEYCNTWKSFHICLEACLCSLEIMNSVQVVCNCFCASCKYQLHYIF